MQASDQIINMENFSGAKRKTELFARGSRKRPKLVSVEEELSIQIDQGNVNEVIEILDDIFAEGYLTVDVGNQLDEYLDLRRSVSPSPEFFPPIKRHLSWLRQINDIH